MGRPSKYPLELRERAVGRSREAYPDSGPTLPAE